MKSVWKKYNIWINVGIFLLIMGLTWFFAAMPIRENIEKNADDIQKKMIDNELIKARISKIPEMENTQEIFSENRDNLRVVLSTNSEVDFIKQIEALAEETGNKIGLKIANKEVVKKSGTGTAGDKPAEDDIKNGLSDMEYLIIQISLEGNYAGVTNFLHKLENMNYYVNVVSLDLIKSVAEEEANKSASPFVMSENPVVATDKTEKEVLKSNLEAVVYLEK